MKTKPDKAAEAPAIPLPVLQKSTATLVSQDDLYDPFSQRPETLQYSDFGAWAHMVKAGMGTGIMAMPMAFRYGGVVVGLLGTPLVGLICGHCVLLLVATAQHLYVRARVPAMTMDEVAYYAFLCGPHCLRRCAPAARMFVQGALFLTYFFVGISYTIFIGEAIQQLVEQWTGEAVLDRRVYIAVLAVVLVPLCQIRQMRTLVPFSVAANVCIVVGFAITMYYLLDRPPDMNRVDIGPTLLGLPIFFSTSIYSMEGIGTVMPVENTMRNPGHLGGWKGLASRAVAFIVVLFTAIGLLGYMRFGLDVKGSIVLNLDPTAVPAQVVKALLALAIVCTFPLQFYILLEQLTPVINAKVTAPNLRNWAQVGTRVFLVAASLLVAVSFNSLELVIALMGAVLFSTLGLLIPAGAHLIAELGQKADAKVSGTQRSSAWSTLTLVKDGFLVGLSLLTTCAGVYSALTPA
ncbi:proton-coupled amino acid transporter-like protein pathetic [Thrips palmi]|uniref:Proton-coupled amino acid transporter-like protein pathetic n=1 Tax=Thrips palmi TaxID=161013 RepID=A0A6P8YH95_THRPL|nr:proton-coupled amino acid transporter-like protein pathetic [Thrips palmi]XP_034235937.1 proton-coupled amino acid transporter-like protein pathetic [Thrips palmi]XP_034235938.1 proton-coupled amino acid transporter-like protein pathetic [Thrips palmi]XP_034235939.1 proton-coupled amino acid transporter-like protein pathetic [Thrips palmi]